MVYIEVSNNVKVITHFVFAVVNVFLHAHGNRNIVHIFHMRICLLNPLEKWVIVLTEDAGHTRAFIQLLYCPHSIMPFKCDK